MRTALEIMKRHLGGNLNMEKLTLFAFEEIINAARKEAIQECAERATAEAEWYRGRFTGNAYVNKSSILNLINELE